jgi:hypothetical protein
MILQNEEAMLRMFLKPFKDFLQKLKRSKLDEISLKIYLRFTIVRMLAAKDSNSLRFSLILSKTKYGQQYSDLTFIAFFS